MTTPTLQSRLPQVGTTIFTVMSALAQQTGAVNLGQGFPDFECDPALLGQVGAAMAEGLNQYPPSAGAMPLRQAQSDKVARLYGRHYDPDTEVTVTAGATQAIFTAVLACVQPGDEVIVLEPCYDSYAPNIELAGGTVVRVPLTPGTFRPDFSRLAAAPDDPHAAAHHQQPAQPERHGMDARRDAAAGRVAGSDPGAADLR
jgi:methionine aminotransferase